MGGKCEVGLKDTQRRRQHREKPREQDEILEGAAHRGWKGLKKYIYILQRSEAWGSKGSGKGARPLGSEAQGERGSEKSAGWTIRCNAPMPHTHLTAPRAERVGAGERRPRENRKIVVRKTGTDTDKTHGRGKGAQSEKLRLGKERKSQGGESIKGDGWFGSWGAGSPVRENTGVHAAKRRHRAS